MPQIWRKSHSCFCAAARPLELLSNFDRILRGQFEVNHFQVRYSTQFFPFVFNSLKCVYLTYFQRLGKLHLASLIAKINDFLHWVDLNYILFFSPKLVEISFVTKEMLILCKIKLLLWKEYQLIDIFDKSQLVDSNVFGQFT